jgi:hypothetical protein
MTEWFKTVTRPVRYGLIRLLSRGVYEMAVASHPRPPILYLKLTRKNEPLTGAEIGVGYGVNAENIMQNLTVTKLWLIDPYVPFTQTEASIRDKTSWTEKRLTNRLEKHLLTSWVSGREVAWKRLAKYGSHVTFIYESSADAVKALPGNLDFVYVDGNHDYEFVKADILNYYPKVKSGGVLGGNDFNCGNGVIQAVTEWTVGNGFRLNVERNDWWVVK